MKHKFVLFKDGTYQTSKRAISKIHRNVRRYGKTKVEMVLIHIRGYTNLYTPVKMNPLMKMDHGIIRYHMRLMLSGSAVDTSDDIVLLDYYPTEIEIFSYEELIEVYHNISTMLYLEHSTASNCTEMNIPYMDICACSIEIEKNDKTLYHYDSKVPKKKRKEIPYKYTQVSAIIDDISEDIGIHDQYAIEMASYENSFQKLELFYHPKRGMRWEFRSIRHAMYTETMAVGIINPLARTILMMDDMVYEELLKIDKATIYIATLETDGADSYQDDLMRTRRKHPIYEITYDETPQDSVGINEWEIYNEIIEAYSYVMDNPDDVIFFICYLPHVMKLYREVIKGMIVSADQYMKIEISDEQCMHLDDVTAVLIDVTCYMDNMVKNKHGEYLRITTETDKNIQPDINTCADFIRRNFK